jgi:hypothetical protein
MLSSNTVTPTLLTRINNSAEGLSVSCLTRFTGETVGINVGLECCGIGLEEITKLAYRLILLNRFQFLEVGCKCIFETSDRLCLELL